MKRRLVIQVVICFSILFAIPHSCKKSAVPDLTTASVTTITSTSAVSGGDITNNGGAEVTSRGVCWGISKSPSINSSKTSDGAGNGPFTSNITGLASQTTYYVRAYAINSEGAGYGNEVSFTTSTVSAPVLTTSAISSITSTTAVSGGIITADGGGAITGRGVCWNTSTNPTTANSKTTDGIGTGTFVSNITELQPGVTYYVKAYATNSAGTSYASNELTFTTQCEVPSAPVIGTITQPTCSVATGSVNLSGLPSSGAWTITRTPGAATTTGSGTSVTISGLSAGTYTFTVTSAAGCVSTASGNVVINASPAALSAPVVGIITHPTCASSTGSVVLSGLPSAGTWTLTRAPGGVTTTGTGISATVSGVPAGSFTYTVTDANGCVSAASGNIVINTTPDSPTPPAVGTIVQPTCSVATGSVELNGLPSTGTWTITRSPGGITTTGTGNSKTITGLPANATYTFTVTNSSGCVSSVSGNVVLIAQPSIPAAPVVGTITQPTCAISTGSVLLNGLPSTGTWTLTRSPGGITTTGSGVSKTVSEVPAPGTYTFTVTNSSGCISPASGNAVIGSPARPSASTTSATSVTNFTATLNGIVDANNSSTTVTFEYGFTTSYGSTVNATQSPVTGNSNTVVSAGISLLTSNKIYHFRVKAVNCGEPVYGSDYTFRTTCGSTIIGYHSTTLGAPLAKTVTYGIVQTNISGEIKCWITQNLGATNQAASATDATEAAAGWYWQFNRKQGYKYDASRTPSTAWNTSISENSNWTTANDPCYNLLSWRLPTETEWSNADINGAWSTYNSTYASVLKIHAAGRLNANNGQVELRGSEGWYWSSTQYADYGARHLIFEGTANSCGIAGNVKAWAGTIRCIKD